MALYQFLKKLIKFVKELKFEKSQIFNFENRFWKIKNLKYFIFILTLCVFVWAYFFFDFQHFIALNGYYFYYNIINEFWFFIKEIFFFFNNLLKFLILGFLIVLQNFYFYSIIPYFKFSVIILLNILYFIMEASTCLYQLIHELICTLLNANLSWDFFFYVKDELKIVNSLLDQIQNCHLLKINGEIDESNNLKQRISEIISEKYETNIISKLTYDFLMLIIKIFI